MAKDYNLSATPANKQRRPEHARDDDFVVDLLNRAQVGHIATRWEDQPFLTPSTFWYDAAKHVIYFHSNVVGRMRANSDRFPEVCFEVLEYGKPLPSNVALEFSIQYRSVVVFGIVKALEAEPDKKYALYGLIQKYFHTMAAGQEYRPITDQELVRTSVYAITITSWSGKENWPDRADQSPDWPALDAKWFE